MKQQIQLNAPSDMVAHVGLSHFKFSWDNEPPESGALIKDAVVVFKGGTTEPLAKYGCFIQVFDGSDPSTDDDEPFEWAFELVHDFGKKFHEWRLYKRQSQLVVRIDPYE